MESMPKTNVREQSHLTKQDGALTKQEGALKHPDISKELAHKQEAQTKTREGARAQQSGLGEKVQASEAKKRGTTKNDPETAAKSASDKSVASNRSNVSGDKKSNVSGDKKSAKPKKPNSTKAADRTPPAPSKRATSSQTTPVNGVNALNAFVDAPLSQQILTYGRLPEKIDVDLRAYKSLVDQSLPGEDTVIRDLKVDSETAQKRADRLHANEAHQALTPKESPIEPRATVHEQPEAKAAVSNVRSAPDDQLPDKPMVSANYSAIDAGSSEEEARFTAAEQEAETLVSSLDRTIEPRGFDDFKIPKMTLAEDAAKLQSDKADLEEEVSSLSKEGKGILDVSEFAEQAKAGMQSVQEETARAEAKRKADTDTQIASHEKNISQEIDRAHEEERHTIEAQKAEMDAQIGVQYTEFHSQMSLFDDEQKSEIEAAKKKLDAETTEVQTRIDQEYEQAHVEQKHAEKEADDKQKEDSGVVGVAIDLMKEKISQAAEWLKNKVTSIVTKFKQVVCAVLDVFASFAAQINHELGEKLRRRFERFKAFVAQLAEAVISMIHKIIDVVEKALLAIADKLEATIHALSKAFAAAVSLIWEGFKAACQVALNAMKKVLFAVANFYLMLLKKALELAGVDPSILENVSSVARQIFDNPGRFFITLVKGLLGGFKKFGANIGENIKAVFTNLFNMWLGTAGLKLPGTFNLQNLIKFGFDVIGIDVDAILNAIGIEDIEEIKGLSDLQGMKEDVENSPFYQAIRRIKNEGIGAIVEMASEYVSDFVTEIRDYAIETVVQKASVAAMSRLAMLTTPVSGILVALKAAWDLIKFVRENMAAIGELVNAVAVSLASAARGDVDSVSAGVEAALCRFIPLAIDLILRLSGINVGDTIKGVVIKIRAKIKRVVDKIIGKLRALITKSPLDKGKEKTKKLSGDKNDGSGDKKKTRTERYKEAAKHKIDSTVDRGIEAVGGVVDPYIGKAVDSVNNSKFGGMLASVNAKAQSVSEDLSARTKQARESPSDFRDNAKDDIDDSFINEPAIKEINIDDVPFTYKYTDEKQIEEFKRQLLMQQEGMNKIDVGTWSRRVDVYQNKDKDKIKENDRIANGARKEERVIYYRKLKEKNTVEAANKEMEHLDALHEVDMYAGGDPDNVIGMGSNSVNRSIGIQWTHKDRIPKLKAQVQKQRDVFNEKYVQLKLRNYKRNNLNKKKEGKNLSNIEKEAVKVFNSKLMKVRLKAVPKKSLKNKRR